MLNIISLQNCNLKQQWGTTTHLLEWPQSRIPTTSKAGEEVEQQELLLLAGRNAEWYSQLWKTIWQFLLKLNVSFPHTPIIVLIDIYPQELKTHVHTETGTQIFTAALFMTAKTWRQTRHLSVCEYMNKLWHIQTMGYYSGLKRNELSSHRKTQRNPKCL